VVVDERLPDRLFARFGGFDLVVTDAPRDRGGERVSTWAEFDPVVTKYRQTVRRRQSASNPNTSSIIGAVRPRSHGVMPRQSPLSGPDGDCSVIGSRLNYTRVVTIKNKPPVTLGVTR